MRLLVVLLIVYGAPSKCLRITTSSGIVDGSVRDGIGLYLGIPYAEPPVGDLRFAKPVIKASMSGVYNATYVRPRCPQLSISGDTSEDCLYLNVYAPTAAGESPRPVMVFVHGGSYLYGGGDQFDGSLIAAYNDVIVVNLNYRLGALGFLNIGEEDVNGNFGLWDQTMALTWIKSNIAAFGGSPEDVTVFGESAGASSITQLAMSPFTEGLFKRVIAQSGTAYAPWTHNQDSLQSARTLAKSLDCPQDSNKSLIDCLRKISAGQLVEKQHAVEPAYAFSPTYRSEFLPYTPEELVTSKSNSRVARRIALLDFIIGLNVDDGGFFYTGYMSQLNLTTSNGVSRQVFENALATSSASLGEDDRYLTEHIKLPLEFMYTDWSNRNDNIARARKLVLLLSDSSFLVPIITFARATETLQSKLIRNVPKSTWVYLYKHRGSWMPMEPWRTGADHADDIPFVFGFPLSGLIPVRESEKQLSLDMMAYWSNFAKTGNPNSGGSRLLPTVWPVFRSDTQQHIELDIGMTANSVGQYVFNDRVAFWTEFIPNELKRLKSELKPTQC